MAARDLVGAFSRGEWPATESTTTKGSLHEHTGRQLGCRCR